MRLERGLGGVGTSSVVFSTARVLGLESDIRRELPLGFLLFYFYKNHYEKSNLKFL